MSHLSFCNRPQGFNSGQFDVNIGHIVEEAHNHLYHLCDGLLELAMFLRQQQHLLVQQTPITRFLAYCDDSNQ